ncbi:hypothetical protein CG50_07485 [Paenirhodobacter enshiensis]|uniref:Uncharacterized protein n=2 Tax=Paenirhodobacter enshiensis TaxID=1105367 RepID=A0A086XS99_9RHOB|nr:hypothetical protein CG50_07485 [Paenirhodobacter enshiensis]
MGRLRFVADALGAPMPEGLPADLLAEDEAPAPEVLRFCRDYGASLDFIYLGDVASLIRYASRAMLGKAA